MRVTEAYSKNHTGNTHHRRNVPPEFPAYLGWQKSLRPDLAADKSHETLSVRRTVLFILEASVSPLPLVFAP